MPSVSQAALPRFASLPEAAAARAPQRSRLVRFLSAPFADVDDRVARLAAAAKAEREERLAVMSDAGAPQRG